MPEQVDLEQVKNLLLLALEETFERVHGIYLDRGTSLFETLETISAEVASRPVSARCASIAGQVEHVRFYVELLERYLKGEQVEKVDWQATWWLTSVTPEEWQELKDRLREAYRSAVGTIRGTTAWDDEHDLGDALAILVHTAYHLGEIRQALCTVR